MRGGLAFDSHRSRAGIGYSAGYPLGRLVPLLALLALLALPLPCRR